MIAQRLSALRELLRREHLAAFIFPTSDPHQSEYTADHWKGREWISGFDGSAGTAVVTIHGAALWTDSRYFLAAEEQLKGTEFVLMRQGMEGTPTIAEWIASDCNANREPSTEVGIDGWICSEATAQELTSDLRQHGGFTLRTSLDPLDSIWTDRPPIPTSPVVYHPLCFSGIGTDQKLNSIRRALRCQHADGMLMAALDDIAWTLNLRGTDVHCNPVFVAYLLISTTSATLFINKKKLTPEVCEYLDEMHIDVSDYQNVRQGLAGYFEQTILMDPHEVCHTLFKSSPRQVIAATSPVPAMKAVKNTTEQQGFREVMKRDGVAMVQLLMLLDRSFPDSLYPHKGARLEPGKATELSVVYSLEQSRRQQENYRGPSFDTIAAYGPHGAIVHYEPTPTTDVPLLPHGLLLIDSGGQYLDGTTDITRTVAIGPLTDEERRVYTLVLKGHLQLQNLQFPEGATGTQLDAVARAALWRNGLNYLHGTGHGVGSYLCVHEGPHQIRMEWRPQPLKAGMTVTCEPGIYLKGRFGVRIENTLLVVPGDETECGRFLRFEPLTLCPIDRRPIIPELLTEEERQWLDAYHLKVREALWHRLSPDEQLWLQHATRPIAQV